MFHSFTLDDGRTWTQGAVGPPGSLSDDGLGAGAFRFDPMGIFDRFGNYYCVYGGEDPVTTNRFVFIHQSADGGQTFASFAAFPLPVNPNLDRWTVDSGPRSGTLPGSTDESILCGLVDFTTGNILVSLVTTPGLGGGVFPSGTATVNDVPTPPGRFYQHGTPSVSAAGEIYVSFVEGDGGPVFPTANPTFIWIDPLTLPGGVPALDVLVDTTVNAAFRIIPITPMFARGKGCIPVHKVVRAGPHAGRIVIVWEDMNLSGPVAAPSFDLSVMSQVSDDDAQTWSVKQPVHGLALSHQFFPWIATDPATGHVYVGYYDTRNDAANNRATQWFVTASEDGVSWEAPVLVAQAPSDAGAAGGGNDMLEYNGITVLNDCVYTCWADNSNFTGDNPDGTLTPDGFDVLTSVLAVDAD
jgi:hypothetical protein